MRDRTRRGQSRRLLLRSSCLVSPRKHWPHRCTSSLRLPRLILVEGAYSNVGKSTSMPLYSSLSSLTATLALAYRDLFSAQKGSCRCLSLSLTLFMVLDLAHVCAHALLQALVVGRKMIWAAATRHLFSATWTIAAWILEGGLTGRPAPVSILRAMVLFVTTPTP